MPWSAYLEQHILDLVLGDTAYSIPATYYHALYVAPTWAATTSYTSGSSHVVGTAFNSSNQHIYLCTTSGTSGASEPTWNQALGGTTTDGTAVWTEQTPNIESDTDTTLEVTGNAYARVAITNNTTNFPVATGSNPATITNGTAINFPTATPSGWGQIVASALFDASTVGNLIMWGYLVTAQTINASVTPSFGIGSLSFTLA